MENRTGDVEESASSPSNSSHVQDGTRPQVSDDGIFNVNVHVRDFVEFEYEREIECVCVCVCICMCVLVHACDSLLSAADFKLVVANCRCL